MSELLDRLLPAAKLAEAKGADKAALWQAEYAKATAAVSAAVSAPSTRDDDESLTWADVHHPVMGAVSVGGEYEPAELACMTSTQDFVRSGNPGSPGQAARFVVVKAIAQDMGGIERDLWEVLQHDVLDELAALAIAELAKPADLDWGN